MEKSGRSELGAAHALQREELLRGGPFRLGIVVVPAGSGANLRQVPIVYVNLRTSKYLGALEFGEIMFRRKSILNIHPGLRVMKVERSSTRKVVDPE